VSFIFTAIIPADVYMDNPPSRLGSNTPCPVRRSPAALGRDFQLLPYWQKCRENLLFQLVQRNVGNMYYPFCCPNIANSTGRRFEHNRIRQDRCRHHSGQFFVRDQSSVLEHGCNDGIGGTHWLIPNKNGVTGLNIRQTILIDDLHDLNLLQTRNRLGILIMIHLNNTLSSGSQQMISGQGTNDLFILI